MKLLLQTLLLLALISSACSNDKQEVDFCQVLTDKAKFVDRTFETEIVVDPDYHGATASAFGCAGMGIGLTDSSVQGRPQLRKLGEEIDRAYRTHAGPRPWKAVAVRVTARIEKDRTSPPYPLKLELLDARDWKLVDFSVEVPFPPSVKPAASESSEDGNIH